MLRKFFIIILIFLLIFSLSCSSLLSGLSDSLYRQQDPQLVEEGAPAFLLLIEGLVNSKSSKDMLKTAIQMFSAYSSAFVKDEDRKQIFLTKAKIWGIQLLNKYPNFKKTQNLSLDEFKNSVKKFKKKDVPYIFWATNAWIMWILANIDDVSALMSLQKAKAIMDRIYEIDDTFYNGAPHLFYGIFYATLPKDSGGDLSKSKEEFDKALKISGDKFLTTKVSCAIFYYKKIGDMESYENLLNEVLDMDVNEYPDVRLLNILAQKSAENLLYGNKE